MKKCFLAVSLLALGAQAKAALFINNNSTCTLNLTIFAFDPTHTGCWGLQSNIISVPPGWSDSYNNVATLNTTAPYWAGGATASTAGGTGTWGWNAAKFSFAGGIGGSTVGLASCGLSNLETLPNPCGGGTITVTWTTSGSNTLIEAN